MGRARFDVNNIHTLTGVSSSDGSTPVELWADPSTHALVVGASVTLSKDNIPATSLTQAVAVQIVDGSGNQITSFGGGTQYTDAGVPPAHPIGPTLLFNNAGAWATVGSATPLPVTGSLTVGGTTDNSAFTAGTTTGTPTMGFYHSTIDTVTDGRAAAVGITNKRAMLVTLQTSAGADTGVAASPLQVSLANTAANATAVKVDGSAVTQPVSGPLTDTQLRASAVPVSLTSTTITGTVGVTQSTSPWVIGGNAASGAADSGNPVKIGGVNNTTQPTLTDGQRGDLQTDTRANLKTVLYANNTATTASFNADNADAVAVSATANKLVVLNRNSVYNGTTWDRLPGDTTGVKIQDGGNSITVDNGGTFAVQAAQSGTWNIGTVTTLTGITNALPAGSNVIGHVITDTGSTTAVTGTVTISGAVTNAGTFAVQATVAAGATNIAKAEDVASADADVGVPAMAIRKATPANTSGTDGDYEMLQISAGRLWVSATIDTALPAGAAVIGKVSIDQTTPGTTNLVALTAETTKVIGVVRNSDGAGNLLTSNSTTYTAKFALDGNLLGTLGTAFSTAGKVDVKGADGDVFVRQTTAANLNMTASQGGTWTVQPGNTANTTAWKVDGSAVTQPVSIAGTVVVDDLAAAATGAAVPSNAQYQGNIAKTSLPTAASDGNLTGNMSDKYGRSVMLNNAIRDIMGTQTTTITASTSETTIITQIASTFNDLVSVFISNTSATAARVDIRDTTAGSVIFQLYIPAGDMRGLSLTTPWPQTTVNTNWTAQSSTSVTDLRISALYIKNK